MSRVTIDTQVRDKNNGFYMRNVYTTMYINNDVKIKRAVCLFCK